MNMDRSSGNVDFSPKEKKPMSDVDMAASLLDDVIGIHDLIEDALSLSAKARSVVEAIIRGSCGRPECGNAEDCPSGILSRIGDILEIADEGNEEDTQRAKLRIDARKWLMSKIAPKKHGDKVMNEHSGRDGGPIPVRRFEVEFVEQPGSTDKNT